MNTTEYKRRKRKSPMQKIPEKALTQQRKYKMQKAPNPKHPGNPEHNEKPNLRIIGIEESEDSQLNGPVNIFYKQ